MILQGFEIENWACIKKLSVANLPSSGVIVLHGPNRTGKSSIVKALRACLMDYSSTSTALKSSYPKGSGEKPLVGVTFASGGKTYRVRKWFGSSKSELAMRASQDAWRVETATASEVHTRMCDLAGGDDSSKGLRQLLWLTQAEFQLPEAKKFDAGVQTQLRGILGVLQTPLDDHFIAKLRERWNKWYPDQRKAGKTPALKKGCELAKNVEHLGKLKAEFDEGEQKFREVEDQIRQASALEAEKHRLASDLTKATQKLQLLQAEQLRCRERIVNRQRAEEQYAAALSAQTIAAADLQSRQEAVRSLAAAESDAETARQRVMSAAEAVDLLLVSQRKLNSERETCANAARLKQPRLKQIAAALASFDDKEKLAIAQETLARAQDIAKDFRYVERYLVEHPAPPGPHVESLKQNRQRALQLQAARDAASMTLSIQPVAGACAAGLKVDEQAPTTIGPAPVASLTFAVQHRAELNIPGWGSIEFSRGASATEFDKIDSELDRLQQEFANGVAPFGIPPQDPSAIDLLLRLVADFNQKRGELRTQDTLFKKAAPAGLEPLQRKVTELQTRLQSRSSAEATVASDLPVERSELESLQAELQVQFDAANERLVSVGKEIEVVAGKVTESASIVTKAKEVAAGCDATVNGRREVLAKLRSEMELTARVAAAQTALQQAEQLLQKAELTADERTIDERLSIGKENVEGLQAQIAAINEKYHRIRGLLEGVEGLHKKRSALAAKSELLSQLVEAETLEKDAVDRLYELFEECREKQLNKVTAPVEQRVLNWMRALELGDYDKLRFGDAFLPEQLVRRDGTAEFSLDEESTGAQEQIGMLVRLALGSLLATTAEPALAILDDPLTHCDANRLANMRRILRRAADGDETLTPPSGRLQILILTCHPEWFRDSGATIIDLEDSAVMQRYAG
jgi:energy-coupling factor transporter ATP-binding protein EcfA2